MEEYVDLYDKNFQKLNQTCLRSQKLPERTYRYVVHICIFNSNGEMLIQRRAKNRKSFSYMWDVSVGGGVTAGDTPQQSATRELKEELGYDYDFSYDRPVVTVHFETGFDDYDIWKRDVNLDELVLQESEVDSVRWANKKEILELIEKQEFIPYKKSMIDFLFETKKETGAYNLK